MKKFLSGLVLFFAVAAHASFFVPNGSITTGKIADGAVTTNKLSNESVETSKIADLNVTTQKLSDESVTKSKLAPLGQQLSSSSGSFSTSSTSYVDVTNLSVTITTTGRLVVISLVPDGTTNNNFIAGNIADTTWSIRILRGATEVARFNQQLAQQVSFPPSVVYFAEAPSAGTYTYKVQVSRSAGTSQVLVYYVKLLAYEL